MLRDQVVPDHAPRAGRARLRGDRDADPHALHPRGRPRLPGPRPPAARLLLRAAPVAPALQAAADDRRVRALLPDRPLLPRRGSPRRSPARVHPARRRALLRGGGGRHRDHRARHGRGVRGHGLRRPASAVAAHALRGGDAALRDRPPRHPLRPGDRGRGGGALGLGVPGLRGRAGRRRRGARHQRRARTSCRAPSSTRSPRAPGARGPRAWCGPSCRTTGAGARRSRSS